MQSKAFMPQENLDTEDLHQMDKLQQEQDRQPVHFNFD
jgi:hypothetical protein